MCKKITIAIMCYIYISTISAQSFTGVYSDNDGSTYTGGMNRIATDNFGNVINTTTYYNYPINIEGTVFPINGTVSSVVIKRDANHDLIWVKSLTCGGVTYIGDVYCDDYSNVYVCGYFGDNSVPTELNCEPFTIPADVGMHLFVIKYAPNGEVLWSRTAKVGLSGGDYYADAFKVEGNGTDKIIVSSPFVNVGEQTIGGTTISTDDGEFFFAGLSSDGDWQYVNLLPGVDNTYLSIEFDYADNDDIFYTANFKGTLDLGSAGILSVPGSSPQDCAFKSDSNGNFEWALLFEASSWWKSDVVCDGNDAVVFGSFGGEISFGTFDLGPTYYSAYGVKIDNAGNYLWAKKYGESEANFFIATKSDEGFYITGKTTMASSSNIFDSYELIYTNTMPSAAQSNSLNYLLKLNSDGSVENGAVTSFSFDTYNTEEMSFFSGNLYLTGNATDSACFGYYVLNPVQINSANYVSVYSENNNIISGSSFYDFNSNYSFDPDEFEYHSILNLNHDASVFNTIVDGFFNIGAGTGVYDLELLNPPMYYNVSTTSYSINFGDNYGLISEYNDFVFQPIPDQNDLVVDMHVGAVRPGYSGNVFVTLKNIGTTHKTGILEFSLTHPEIDLVSAVPAASLMESNDAEFDYDLYPSQEIVYQIIFQASVLAELETEVVAFVSAPDALDLTIDNNSVTMTQIITGSWDPNSKEVYPRGNIFPDFITNSEHLEYVINFQNTGTDTAFTVILIDTLSANLDISSFRLISASHDVVVNLYDNVLWFRFNHINLVDSVMNEEMSHGFVKFKIKPLPTLLIGDIIENNAAIYFDYNIPVITNTTVTEIINFSSCQIQKLRGTCSVYPNPCKADLISIVSENLISKIVVENNLGQVVGQIQVNGQNEAKFDFNDKENGLYLIKIYTEKGLEIAKLMKVE
ncbi:MAG TPA: T9SS type A sorting domain-containing protein [Bacteroidales bacterium]|nr:T9SS type A sorting domain-containing protein [Bacteroidales bacterium]